jgi:hypothetical protein
VPDRRLSLVLKHWSPPGTIWGLIRSGSGLASNNTFATETPNGPEAISIQPPLIETNWASKRSCHDSLFFTCSFTAGSAGANRARATTIGNTCRDMRDRLDCSIAVVVAFQITVPRLPMETAKAGEIIHVRMGVQ